MQLDYIWPVESNGDTPQILGWGCDILILASFEGVQSSTRRKHVRIKSFQTPYKHALRMTFLLQTQKLIMSNAWNLTKFIIGHDSKTSSFSQTITTLHIQCCRSSVFRVMTSDQLCQVPRIWHKKFLSLQQKCHPWYMFIWSLKGFCSNMFPSGGTFDPLKWGQNEDGTASS